MLKISGLNKNYSDFQLRNVSFELPKGYIMGLVGKNGAGKTTIIKCIMNMVDFEGKISVDNMDNVKNETEIKMNTGIITDQPFFPYFFSLEETGKYFGSFYSSWSNEIYFEYLEKFGLKKDKKVNELSRGMGVKLQLAAAMSHKAKLLILDEPTSGLDAIARDELMDILMEYIENGVNSILFSTHISSDLEKIADYITIIRKGELFYTGEKDEIISKYCIVKGDIRLVSDDMKKSLIGIRRYDDSFEAMIEKKDCNLFGNNLFETENAGIDDILLFSERSK